MSTVESKVNLQICELINFKGRTLDIISLVQGFDLCEDIFSSTLYGSISIVDTHDLKNNFPLIGEERLRLKFKTDAAEFDWIDREFYVFTIPGQSESDNNSSNFTVLSFCSEEMILNRTQLVSRSFGNLTPTEVVKKTLESLPSNKDFLSEETFNIQTYISPNIHPFEVISSMTTRAKSKEFVDSSGFLFFETVDGFNFKSLDWLITNGTVHTYTVSLAGFPEQELDNQFYAAISVSMDSKPDILESVNSGMYGNTTYSFNIQDRLYEVISYNYFNDADYKKTVHLEGSNPDYKLQTSQFSFADRVTDSMLKFVPKYSGDQMKDSNISIRYAQLAQFLNGIKIRLEVSGNSALRVGHIIDIDFPNRLSDDVAAKRKDLFMNGRFLITSLRHLVEGDKFRTFVELTKDSYSNSYEEYADELFDKIDLSAT